MLIGRARSHTQLPPVDHGGQNHFEFHHGEVDADTHAGSTGEGHEGFAHLGGPETGGTGAGTFGVGGEEPAVGVEFEGVWKDAWVVVG